MQRNPQLALEAAKDPDIIKLKFKAIDKVTAANIVVNTLNRFDQDPVKELEKEEQARELMEDSLYLFGRYLRSKLRKYEQLLRAENSDQSNTIKHGNKVIKDNILPLAKERGVI